MMSYHDELLKEAHAYFKSHGILLRLAKEFLKKYRSLGHFGGFPVLKNLQSTEQSTLSAFLRRKVDSNPRIGYKEAASWALLDRLSENGATLLYAGDFDPEGLGIAHRLLSRYDMAALWHMGTDEYKRAVQDLPEERLKKLPSPIHRKLQSLAQEMISKKKVLYQESLIEDLTLDLSNSK